MELAEIRTSTDRLRFSHSRVGSHKIFSREEEQEEEEAHLRGEQSNDDPTTNSPVVNMMEYHHQHHQAAYVDSPSYGRLPRASVINVHNHHVSFGSHPSGQHPWTRSPSVSSLSNWSSGSDSDAGGVTMMSKSSAKSSPMGSDCSMNNYDLYQTDESGACSARTIMACGDMGGEMEVTDDRMQSELSYSSTPSAEELSEVFTWVDENNDGLICGADLRGFMSRVLSFEISDSEAETLLLVYSNGRTLRTATSPNSGGRRNGGGAVVDFEGFLALYQCLCGEQASPEEQSMMAAASRVFDKTQLQSGRWV